MSNNIVQSRTSLVPTNLGEAMEFSKVLSQSAMIPRDYQGKPANVLVAVQWGMELGLAPMQALQNIAVINGKPSVYGDALLAMVRADTRCRGVKERIEGKGDDRVAICTIFRMHIDGDVEEIERSFSVSDAKQANLWGKPGPWKMYTERMMQHRARGNAIRDAFPDVIKGLITVEEAQDYPAEKPVKSVQPPKLEELGQQVQEALEPVKTKDKPND